MTEIYVNQSSGGKKIFILPAILVALLCLTGFVLWQRGRAANQEKVQSQSTETLPSMTEVPASVPPDPTPQATADIVQAVDVPSLNDIEKMIKNGELEAAREQALIRLSGLQNAGEIMETEKLLGDLNTRMIFTRAPMPEKVYHVVKSGDTLGGLAKKYGTTMELISDINGLENNIIRLGKSLQILTGEFSILVDKSSNELELRLNNRFFKRYVVGTGTDSSTPTGDYVVTLRLRHPVWYRPDGLSFEYGHPENLLGTHYLKLNTPGIGIHGTWEPESVGSQSSAGCVRLKNEMIEELYKIIPEGTPVRIVD